MNKRNLALFGLSLLVTIGTITSVILMSSKSSFANLFAYLTNEETSVDLVNSLKGKSLDGEGKVSFERNGYEFVFQGENVSFDANSITINAGGYLRNETCFNGLHHINYSASGAFKIMTGSVSDKIITKHASFAVLSSGTSVDVGGEHFMIAADDSDVTLSSLSLDFTCSTTGKVANPDDRWDATWTWSLAGVGSETDPYVISTKTEWDAFTTEASTNLFRGRHFKLGADIGTELDPVTTFVNNTTSLEFSGHLDGNNKEIWISLSPRNKGRTSLFTYAARGASFKDLIIRGNVDGGDEISIASSLVASVNTGSVSFDNIKNYASVTVLGTAAGIVGHIYGNGGANGTTFTNCENYGALTATAGGYSGGIVGNNDGSAITISSCNNYGVITGTKAYLGGIVGNISKYDSLSIRSEISNCTNHGEIITSGYTVVNTKKTARLGGIIGMAYQTNISSCDNYGLVHATNKECSGEANSNEGSGNIRIGYIIGYQTSSATVTECTNHYGVQQN